MNYQIRELLLLQMKKHSNDESDIFNQYFSSEVIPNNRLLLKSFSNEIWRGSPCVIPRMSQEFFRSKIIFIDLKNFEEIKSTETFEAITNVVIYQNLIIIQIFEREERMFIYDINSLEIISNKEFIDEFGIFLTLIINI